MVQRNVLSLSVTEDEQPKQAFPVSGLGYLWFSETSDKPAGTLLPQWGDPARLPKLRQLFYDERNALVGAAIQGFITRVAQTPWELSGPKTRTPIWQNILQYPNEGEHFTSFLSKAVLDYATIDQGAFIELIGRGNPKTELKEAPVGFKVLDSLRCYPAGGDDQPVYYRSFKTGALHELHPSRVIRWVDTPSPDPRYRALGYSMMSRAVQVSHISMLLFRNHTARLDNKPANGFILYQNLNENRVNLSKDNYRSKESMLKDPFSGYLEFFGLDPAYEINVTVQEFSQMPDGADLPQLFQLLVNLAAVALEVDPQDIFPLASSAMGSGEQSKILQKKGEAKKYGKVLTELERLINTRMIPRNMEFKFKTRDDEGLQQEAAIAQQWVTIGGQIKSQGLMSDEAVGRLLANNVTAIADVILDEDGQVRLPDDDVKETQSADDQTPLSTTSPDEEMVTDDKALVSEKAIQATRLHFENDIGNLFEAAVGGEFNRRRFGVRARALIARYGRMAYFDGLEEEGVNRQDASEDDYASIGELAAEQSQYVTAVGEAIYLDERVTPDEAAGKPQLWWNKSIEPFYRAGQMSAGRNGYKMWGLGPTEEHCSDCARLDGQVHRLRDWMRKGLFPKSSTLECQGFRCECSFSTPPAGSRARGRF